MLGQSITRNSILLAVFAVVTTLLIAGTYLQTRDRIALEERKAEEKWGDEPAYQDYKASTPVLFPKLW